MTEKKKSASVVVVGAADFLDALRCAVVFTGGRAYPGVRVDVNPDDLCIEVSARVKNHITATRSEVAWCRIVDEQRDLAFELSVKQVRDLLQVFKNYNKRSAGEEESAPQIGIHLTENEITWHDETGLGLSVHLYSCSRVSLDTPSLFHAIDTVAESVVAEMAVNVSVDQLGELYRVAKSMGTSLAIVGIPRGASGCLHRHLVVCDRFRSVMSIPIEHDRSEGDGQEGELNFDDAIVCMVPRAITDSAVDAAQMPDGARASLCVVSASPAGGIA